jgi:hypothetical protein
VILQIVHYSLLTFLIKSQESGQMTATKFQTVKTANNSTVYNENLNYPNGSIEKSYITFNDNELALRMDSYKAVAEILQ